MNLVRIDEHDFFQLNTPVQEVSDPLLSKKQIRLFIKRDDMIHPFISGNKWRKLKYILKAAGTHKLSALQTFGGAFSNHLLATACIGAMMGYKTSAYVRGEDSAISNDTLFLCRQFNMDLQFISREEYKEISAGNTLIYTENILIIPEGGRCREGSLGCGELIAELDQEFDSIFLACGTGTTAAGVADALRKSSLQTRLELIVVLKGATYLEEEIRILMTEKFPIRFHHDFHGGGYAKADSELLNWMQGFSSATGILLDPVYTGKALKAVFSLAAQDYFTKGTKILFVHTGGLTGLLGFKNFRV